MSKILFLVSDEAMIAQARDVLGESHIDIELSTAFSNQAVKVVHDYIAQGVDVVAARAGTALTIKQAEVNITVVEIPITSIDIIRAICEEDLRGQTIAFITYSTTVFGLDTLADVLGVTLFQHVVHYGDNIEQAVKEAASRGANVMLGGARVVAAAKHHGIPYILLKLGKESLLQAAREAVQIQKALEIEAAKSGFFSTIIDYAYDGIVTIDQEHNITALNPKAQQLVRIDKVSAFGQNAASVLPQFHLSETVDSGIESLHNIIDVNGTKVICNKIPITVNGRPYGAVATFQDISKIQQMEEVIRRKIYARGHVAKIGFSDIVGKSPIMIETIEMAKDFAVTNSNILVLGETGTGKEYFAQSIHNASKRANGPFIAINCAALPAQILESELFGYVGGAFTGANKEGKQGLFEVAHGGTIFLDEIAETDYVNQGRLLRVLQEKTVVRLGSHKVIPVDVRVIAATNKNLEELIDENKFRDDLYYRLNVLTLELPPLKERKADIHLYAETFLRELSVDMGRRFRLTKDALQLLEDHAWLGNIRELKNVMERVVATCKSDVINSKVLSMNLRKRKISINAPSSKEDRVTREIMSALKDAKGNYTAAAQILGIHRMTLRRRMQKLNIEY